jgi:hypothetical protein
MTPVPRAGLFLAVLLLAAVLMLPVSAFSVSSVAITPQGNQPPGTPMTVRSIIDFPRTGSNVTFPQESELHMTTDLAGAYWVPILVLDGKEIHLEITSGEEAVVTGYYLNYPAYQNVQLVVTLTGNIPTSSMTSQNLLKVEELDADKNMVSTAHIAMPDVPVMSIPVASTAPPTKKPTIKKTITPLATATTTPGSPAGTGPALIAVAGAALLALRRHGQY